VNIAGAFAQDLPTVNWTAAVLPGAPWLSTTTTAGTSTISTPGTASYSIDAGLAAGLAPGVYYGTVRISAMGVNDAPLDFEVVLNVAAAGGLAMPAVSPEGLVFVSKAGQSPAPQTVQLYSSNGATTSYQAGASSNSLVWLSVSPTAGTALSSLKVLATSTVSVTTAGLAPGVYYGGVSYAGASAAVRTINTTLIVIPSSGTCTPSQVVPARIGLVSGFSVSALSPAPLAVQLLNDCGGMVANGQLTATFSNGDAPLPLTLTNPGMGVYSTTWIPRQPSGGVTVTVSASAPGLASSSVSYAGSVLPNGSAPTLAPLSTLHVFNPATGAAVAPGTIVQIYGSNLAGQTLAATGVPLPGALGGTSVSIGGIVAPLFFVSPGQINAQAPFELAAEGQYQVVVNSGGLLSTPDTVHVSAVAPGVAALASGIAIAQHGDASLVSEQSPAKPGEALVLYAAGLGATDTPVASGAGSPSSPLAHPANAVSLTINGEVAAIQFGGLTPGLVGLYQVNFTVPTDAANGDLQLVLSEGGASANPVILPVHM
jgi:adhesin/invasin